MTKNLKLTCLVALALLIACCNEAAAETPWTVLFDGNSTAAWKGYQTDDFPDGWVVEEGALKNESARVDLVTKQLYADFEFSCEWKIGKGGNSGIVYRCDEGEDASYMTGPEFQLIDHGGWELEPTALTATGALYGLYAPTSDATKPTGDWNSSRIVVRGDHVEHWLNGKQIVAAEIASEAWNEKVSGTKFARWKRFASLKEGRIALQAHPGKDGATVPTWFRDVRVRSLESEASHE